MSEVFVYGTLTVPARRKSVLDSVSDAGPATLEGLHRVDGTYPTLAPGGSVDGRLIETPEIDRLDRYEGVESGLYVRVSVPRATGGDTEVYVGDPARLGVDVDWPGTGPFPERVRAYVRESEVSVCRR